MRILIVTDSHLAATASAHVANWRAVGDYARRASIDLTIHLGDITYDAINASSQLDEAQALVAQWPTPMRCIPGNHDVGDNRGTIGVPEGEWTDEPKRALFRAAFGESWWSFDADGWKVVALDAQLFGSDLPAEHAQWTWFDAVVANAAERPIAIALHKPLYEHLATDPDHHPRLVPHAARDRLLDACARADVRLVMSGHAHQYLDRVRDGVRHVWFPSCAFVIPDARQRRFGEKFVGVGVLELAPRDYRLEMAIPHGVDRNAIA